jgi:hypothetical protein
VLLRAPSNVATIGGSGWADKLAATAVADVVTGLAPISAAADLIGRGLRVNFDSFASITIPGLVAIADEVIE